MSLRPSIASRPLLGTVLLGTLGACLLPAWSAADDLRVQQVEIDVRDLKRTVAEQARRIDDLERYVRQLSASPGTRSSPPRPFKEGGTEWLDPKNWDRVRKGMTAQEVIAILGVPASMRDAEGGGRVLLYATQIGATGFLGGSVTLADDKVQEIARPVLR
jgi:hypothetical protein